MKILKWTALAIGAFVLIVLVTFWVLRAQLAERMAIDIEHGIDETHQVMIGGTEQWLYVRGHDASKPFVLYVDGGPGKPSTSWLHLYELELEHDAVMVHWEQRGAGRSWHEDLRAEDMNIEQFVADGIEVIDWIRNRYGVDKVVLLGHSFGSLLGTLLADRVPDKVAAYIGAGQAVDILRGWDRTLADLREQARSAGDPDRIAALEAVQLPTGDDAEVMEQFFWFLTQNGCEVHGQEGYGDVIAQMYLSPLYDYAAHRAWMKGLYFSAETMMDELKTFDLQERVTQLDVPIAFLLGRYDCNANAQEAADYFQVLGAPSKRLVWFEQSAHSLPFEEPEKFQQVVADIISDPAISRAASRRR